MLLTRVLTAFAVIAVLIPLLLFGGYGGVAILVTFFAMMAAWELTSRFPGLPSPFQKALTLTICLSVVAGFYSLPYFALPALLVWLPLSILVLHLFLFNHIGNTLDSAAQMILVPFYAVVPLCHAMLLRRMENGVTWILYVLIVNSLGDASAYFAGKSFGKRKFSKNVSPGKTIEGLIGGVAGNFLGMILVKLAAPSLASWTNLFWLTALMAVMGPLGDLCASALKRRLGIKDYGALLPGHGGVMDRADSLILVIPAATYYLLLTGIGGVR